MGLTFTVTQCKCNVGSWVRVLGEQCEQCGDNVICDLLDQEIPKPKNVGDQVPFLDAARPWCAWRTRVGGIIEGFG